MEETKRVGFLAPVVLAVSAAVFAATLRGMQIRAGDRWWFAVVGFGVLLAAGGSWVLRRRFPDQETIAGTARVTMLLAVIIVWELMMSGGSH